MTASPAPALIAVDWGTSRLRVMLLSADGTVLAERDSDDGIATVAAGGHAAAFERLTADWPRCPAVMAGMVGSRQGWREAAYAPSPATPEDLAARVLRFETSSGRPVAIVPGIMLRAPERDGDVIRGEETQMVGLIDRGRADGLVILPGTHSKWATIANGAIAGFHTFLTGEMFELLAHHSFLRHSVAGEGGDVTAEPDFALGVRRTAADGLPFLAAIFSVRVRALLDGVGGPANRAYLSGLVIGGEIAAARDAGAWTAGAPIRIVGAKSLARAYRAAFALLGHETEAVDGTEMVVAGLVHIARRIGFLAPQGASP